jgi:hypothetical protein
MLASTGKIELRSKPSFPAGGGARKKELEGRATPSSNGVDMRKREEAKMMKPSQ